MERINTQDKLERKQNRNKLIVSLVLIFLMFFSTLGFIFGMRASGTSQSDNPSFDGRYWVYNSAGQSFYFSKSPEETSNVPVNIYFSINDYIGTRTFIDSESPEVSAEIRQNLARYASQIQDACYGPCEEDLPEKDCTENVIIFKNSETRKVYQEQKCVFIEGDVTSADAFLYKVLGIS